MGEPERLRRPRMRPNAETAMGFLGCADKGDVAVAAEEVDIRVDVVIGGDGVEDEVEAASGQVPSESAMQPTAERSPGLYLVTAEPTLVTRPTISWPGTMGCAARDLPRRPV